MVDSLTAEGRAGWAPGARASSEVAKVLLNLEDLGGPRSRALGIFLAEASRRRVQSYKCRTGRSVSASSGSCEALLAGTWSAKKRSQDAFVEVLSLCGSFPQLSCPACQDCLLAEMKVLASGRCSRDRILPTQAQRVAPTGTCQWLRIAPQQHSGKRAAPLYEPTKGKLGPLPSPLALISRPAWSTTRQVKCCSFCHLSNGTLWASLLEGNASASQRPCSCRNSTVRCKAYLVHFVLSEIHNN